MHIFLKNQKQQIWRRISTSKHSRGKIHKCKFFKTNFNFRLDWESIRSSPRDGLSTSHRLTKGTLEPEFGLSYFLNFFMLKSYWWVDGLVGWWGGWLVLLDGWVGGCGGSFIYVLAPGILKIVHKVRLKMFSLKMVDYSMSLLSLST